MKTNNGFTLIESLMVLTITVILTCWGLPNLHSLFDEANDEVIKTQLTQAIHFAQAESHRRYTSVGLRLDGAKDILIVLEENNQIIRDMPFHLHGGALHWRAFPSYRDYLLFSPAGLIDNDNATFWYCHRRAVSPAFVLTLSKSGIVHGGVTSNLQC